MRRFPVRSIWRPGGRRGVGAVLAGLLAAACVTPSIPIPPPSPELMRFEVDVDAGEATFAYPANDNYIDAIVYVFNRSEGRGIITTARGDGSVGPTEPIPAAYGQEIAVSFEIAASEFVSTCVVLTVNGPRPDCGR
jgi:hypothetical protein